MAIVIIKHKGKAHLPVKLATLFQAKLRPTAIRSSLHKTARTLNLSQSSVTYAVVMPPNTAAVILGLRHSKRSSTAQYPACGRCQRL